MYKIPVCVHTKDTGSEGFVLGVTNDGGATFGTLTSHATWGREFVSFGRTSTAAGDAKGWSGIYHLDASLGGPNHFGGIPN
jgi:hypothetical protein